MKKFLELLEVVFWGIVTAVLLIVGIILHYELA